jgi:hypothetical protein
VAKKTEEYVKAEEDVQAQEAWIQERGGNLAGYEKAYVKYGPAVAKASFDLDKAQLESLKETLKTLS